MIFAPISERVVIACGRRALGGQAEFLQTFGVVTVSGPALLFGLVFIGVPSQRMDKPRVLLKESFSHYFCLGLDRAVSQIKRSRYQDIEGSVNWFLGMAILRSKCQKGRNAMVRRTARALLEGGV